MRCLKQLCVFCPVFLRHENRNNLSLHYCSIQMSLSVCLYNSVKYILMCLHRILCCGSVSKKSGKSIKLTQETEYLRAELKI